MKGKIQFNLIPIPAGYFLATPEMVDQGKAHVGELFTAAQMDILQGRHPQTTGKLEVEGNARPEDTST